MEELNPGRELDALIAEKVFGLIVKPGWDGEKEVPITYPQYSTDIAAAWEVVEKMNAKDFQVKRVEYGPGQTWMAGVDGYWFDFADTAPHAICLAALKAVNQS